MADAGSIPNLRTQLQTEAKRVFGDKNQSVNESTVKLFVDYVGKLIQQDGSPVELDPRKVRSQAQSVFLAQLGVGSIEEAQGAGAIFESAMDKTMGAMKYSQQGINYSGLNEKAQVVINEGLTSTLASLYQRAGSETAVDAAAEARLIQNITIIAMGEASDKDAAGNIIGFDEGTYQSRLQELLGEHIKALSQDTIETVIDNHNEAGFRAAAFPLLAHIPAAAGYKVKSGVNQALLKQLEAGNHSVISTEAKTRVNQALVAMAKAGPDVDLDLAIAQAGLGEEGATYLQHMINECDRTKDGAGDLADMLAKSLPHMAAPGLLGATIGWMFGSTGLGVVGAIVLQFIGGLGKPVPEGAESDAEVAARAYKPAPKMTRTEKAKAVPASTSA